ncbi:uncharacterized protein LOC125048273 [Penaeus chinensis]|uniref:uncharacterized protein LOC125048273 n=1 Tax=Penaeus chinensis TaxID=139456 RepID=UPI001FB7921E|nr:uncharacterized protein LOC125048273 [Penaeus chinensis]
MKRIIITTGKPLKSKNEKAIKRNQKQEKQEETKNALSRLKATLNKLGSKVKARSRPQVIEETMSLIRDLEDKVSMLLAGIRTERGSSISNSSMYTLSYTKAMFSRYLWEARNKARMNRQADDNLSDLLEKNMEESTRKFFSALVAESSADRPAGDTQKEDWRPEKTLVGSPSPSTTRSPGDGAALATPRTSCHSREGLVTPQQENEEDQHVVTLGLARRKRGRSVSTTPVTTPVSIDTQTPSVSSAGVRKPRSSTCKKSLTFTCDSWQPHRDKPVNRGSPEVDILSSPDAPAVRRRSLRELPRTASADPGGSLPPTKRLRLRPDFDPDIIQELLPLPTHCSTRLLMTPLIALKSSSASPDEAVSANQSQACVAVTAKAEKSPRHEASPQNPRSFRDKVEGKALAPSSDSVRHEAQVACKSSPFLNDINIQARRDGRRSGEADANKSAKESERILTRDSSRTGSHDSHIQIPKNGTESVDFQQQCRFMIDQLGPFSCIKKNPSSQIYNTRESPGETQHNAGSIVVSSITFQDELLGMSGAGEAPLQSNKKANLWSYQLLGPLDSNRKHSPNTSTPLPSSWYQDVQAAGPSKSQAVTPKDKLIRACSREPRSTISQAVTPEGKLAEVSPVRNSPGCLGYIRKQKMVTPAVPGPSGCQVGTPKGILAQIKSPVPSSSYQDVTPKRLSTRTSSSEPGPQEIHLSVKQKKGQAKKSPRFVARITKLSLLMLISSWCTSKHHGS